MILIVGAGAVGTCLATYLSAAGHKLRLCVRAQRLAAFQAAPHLQVERAGATPLIAPKPALVTKLDLDGVDALFLCVKFRDLDGILAQLPRPLPPRVRLVSTLNGVAALRSIRRRFPQQPASQITIMFNAQSLAPLHARMTTAPTVLIDRDDDALLNLFDGSHMRVACVDIEAATWGKLLINLANAVCALTHATFKDLLSDPDLRAIYSALLGEADRILRRAGIRHHLPMPLPMTAYRWLLRNGGALPWRLAQKRNRLSEGAYPSMVADVEAGRPTEVAQLNGEIVALAESNGIEAPINNALLRFVQEMEGRRPERYRAPAQLRRELGLGKP